MAAIITPFTTVVCPICEHRIDRKLNNRALAEHIRGAHPSANTRACVVRLFEKLQLGLPDDLDKVSEQELLVLLENMAQYDATTEGLRRLKRRNKPK